eukprot:9708130-Heterocapsa_arctica.AAC.1
MDVSAPWRGEGKGKGKSEFFDGNCPKCGNYGHRARTCGAAIAVTNNNGNVVCSSCGKKGHWAKDCRGGKGKGKGGSAQQ